MVDSEFSIGCRGGLSCKEQGNVIKLTKKIVKKYVKGKNLLFFEQASTGLDGPSRLGLLVHLLTVDKLSNQVHVTIDLA